MNLKNKITIYKARTYLSEDSFHIATAKILDHLMEMDELAWFHANQNLYRRGLSSLRSYLGEKFKARLTKLAIRLGAKGKKMGIKKGTPDCMIYSHCLTIELKSGKGVASKEQKAWFKRARRWNWTCAVCNTPEAVLGVLEAEGILTREVLEKG